MGSWGLVFMLPSYRCLPTHEQILHIHAYRYTYRYTPMCVYIYIYVYVLYILWKHSNACLVYDLIFCRLRQASNALSKGPETREESAQLEVESMGAPTSTGAVASMHTKHGGGTSARLSLAFCSLLLLLLS